MKKIRNSEKIIHDRKKYSLSDILKIEGLSFSEIEKKIIASRLGKDALIDFSEGFQNEISDALMKISAITGLKIPDGAIGDVFVKIELESFLMDFGFKLLTIDEIILAFRLEAWQIKKSLGGVELPKVEMPNGVISIYYISAILSNYMILRTTLDRKLINYIDGVS